MILCTSCGTKNADDAHTCEKCGRKLQSRWSRGPDANGNGQNGNGKNGDSFLPEEVWQLIEPVVHSIEEGIEEGSDKLVKACAETWTYALLLLAAAGVYVAAEDWRYLAGGVVLTAVLAWARGI
jgi:hypothetical protein